MLVRELIEQLSEMPPELPVEIDIGSLDVIGVLGARRSQLVNGPFCKLVVDPDELAECWQDYVMDRLGSVL